MDEKDLPETIFQQMVGGLLALRSPTEMKELCDDWIRVDLAIANKYKHIDLARIVATNSEKTDWTKCMVNALAEVESCGINLLKTKADGSTMWESITKGSRLYKTITKLEGGVDILKILGYTDESPKKVSIPDFPGSVSDRKNHIACVTAEAVLGRYEVDEFKKGRHPKEHYINECLDYVKVDTVFIRDVLESKPGEAEEDHTYANVEDVIPKIMEEPEVSFEIIDEPKPDNIGHIVSLPDQRTRAKLHETVAKMDVQKSPREAKKTNDLLEQISVMTGRQNRTGTSTKLKETLDSVVEDTVKENILKTISDGEFDETKFDLLAGKKSGPAVKQSKLKEITGDIQGITTSGDKSPPLQLSQEDMEEITVIKEFSKRTLSNKLINEKNVSDESAVGAYATVKEVEPETVVEQAKQISPTESGARPKTPKHKVLEIVDSAITEEKVTELKQEPHKIENVTKRSTVLKSDEDPKHNRQDAPCPNVTVKKNISTQDQKEFSTKDIPNLKAELNKLDRQHVIVEDLVRKLIISDDNFSENDEYLQLTSKIDKFRNRSGKIRKYLQSQGEINDDSKPPPLPKRTYKKKDMIGINGGKEGVTHKPETEAIPVLEVDPNALYLNAKGPKQMANLKLSDLMTKASKPQETPNQDTWQCNCGFLNGIDSLVCDVCGNHKTEPKQVKSSTLLWVCNFCNVENEQTSKTCIACGKTKVNVSFGATIGENEKEQRAKQWPCEHCTWLNPESMKICDMCGKTRGKEVIAILHDWKCPNCYYMNPAGNQECEQCILLDIPGIQEGWECENCTFYNRNMSKTCELCNVKSKPPKGKVLEVEDVLDYGNFDKYYVEDAIEGKSTNDLEAVVIELTKEHLKPVIARIWEETENEDLMDQSIASHVNFSQDLIAIFTDENTDKEWRIRIAMVEGGLEDLTQSEKALILIEEFIENFPEDFGEGKSITMATVFNTVKSDDDLDTCRNRIIGECGSCMMFFPRDQLHPLTYCECLTCSDCFCNLWRVVIKEKNVLEWACQYCRKPDLADTSNQEGHFMFLALKLQSLLRGEDGLFELFTNKLNNWKIQNSPNFVWCANDHCKFGFEREGDRKTQCPACNQYMCLECKIPWPKEHTNRTCDEYRRWLRTEKEQGDIKEDLKEGGIVCPKCKYTFELARGGCMHFKCSRCPHEFCGGCFKEFKRRTGGKGLNCTHPRDCLYYLRDNDIAQLEELLQKHNKQFGLVPQEVTETCPLPILREVVENAEYNDEACGQPVIKSGLCENHYKEHLVFNINKHRLDPVDIMNCDDLVNLLNREKVKFTMKGRNISDEEYLQQLREQIKQSVPLQQEPYQ